MNYSAALLCIKGQSITYDVERLIDTAITEGHSFIMLWNPSLYKMLVQKQACFKIYHHQKLNLNEKLLDKDEVLLRAIWATDYTISDGILLEATSFRTQMKLTY